MVIGLMFARIMALCIGAAIIFLLRFRVFKRGFSPSVSALMAAAAMAAGIQFHYHFLSYESFGGGVLYASLGFIAFLAFNYGYRKTPSQDRKRGR
jgi:glucan phosphoethanolaminetransferase (alkaline phosphatase superfamily)